MMTTGTHAADLTRERLKRALIILMGCLALSACSSSAEWGWYVVDPRLEQGRTNLWFLIAGYPSTIYISAIAAALSMTLGLIVAVMGMSTWRALRILNRIYVEFIRSIPLLPLLFWIYFGLPFLIRGTWFEFPVDPFWAGVITLALSDSAFTAEIYRSGIQSIDRGQSEAAQTVGLTKAQTMRYVILPQAIKRILPPLANQFIYIVKMSAFVSVIGMQELMRRANDLNTNEYRALEIYTVLIFEYLVLVLLISAAVRWLERRMSEGEQR